MARIDEQLRKRVWWSLVTGPRVFIIIQFIVILVLVALIVK